jgi:HEAT repeat protein
MLAVFSPAQIEDGLVSLGAEVVPRLVARFPLGSKPAWVVLLPTLKRLGDPRAAALLFLALGEKREAHRRLAIEVLASLGPAPEVLEALSRALADKKPRVREAAVQVALALGEAGEPLLEPLRRTESDEAVLALLVAQPRAKSAWAERWDEAERLRALPPSPSDEATWYESVRSTWGSAWSAYLDDGLPFLVYLFRGLEGQFYAPAGGLVGAWYGALRYLAREPLARVLGLEHLRASPVDGPRAYTDFLVEVFGESLAEPATYMLLHKPPTHRQALYEWLCGRPSSEGEARALHLVTLEDDSEWMREQAVRVVSSWGAGCLPEVLPKLGSSKATTRQSAAAVLRRVGSEDALPAIQAALAKERSQKVVAELDAARAECDPFLRAMRSRAVSLGAYRFGEPFDVNEALTELRGVLYIDVANPASWERWLRLWDLLERFGEAGCLPMALDYAKGNGVEAWPAEHRKALWGAAGLPGVSPLVTGVAGPGVISVARFAQPAARAAFFKERLPMEERGVRARRFVPDDAGIFLRCVEVGWAWCERQGIPLDHLDVRVDGGTVREKYAGGADSTAIELRGGFAVELFRDSARREGDLRNGVRWLRVRVPKNHPLRAERGMTPRDRFLDLRGELGAEIGPGLV